MTGADVVVEILKREGLEYAFCFPFTPIQESLAHGGIRVITARQERVAGNMADGVSRSTNGDKIGAFTVQSSAGAENAFSPVAHSYTDSTPMLFLPGHPGTDRIGISPSFDSMNNYSHTVKYGARPVSSSQIPGVMRRAFAALRSGRPGPVMVELPGDVCAQEFSGQLDYDPISKVKSGPDYGAVEEAAERILSATNPFIWAGQGIHYAQAWSELRDVAELLGIPVMTTLQGKSCFPETHPLSAGTGAYMVTAMVDELLDNADAVLAVGTSLAVAAFTPSIPAGKTIIHATNDVSDLSKNYATAVAVAADAKLFLKELSHELRRRVGDGRLDVFRGNEESIKKTKDRWLSEYAPLFADDSTPINGYRMFRELWLATAGENAMFIHESGGSRDIQSVFYESVNPRDYLGWGQSSQLGFSIGLAMGAKIANPERIVINVMGDASVGMTGLDWDTSVRENIPIMTVIKHDAIFSGYEKHIPESVARFKSSSMTGDYSSIAKSLGCYSETVESPAQLQDAFKRGIMAVKNGQTAVIDVLTAETRKLSRSKI